MGWTRTDERTDARAAEEPPVRVAVSDKNPLIRLGLRQLLGARAGLELVFDVATGGELLEGLERRPVDVVVTGWIMSSGDGRLVLETLRAREDAPRVVVYSGAAVDDLPEQVLELGGAAFLNKSEPPDQLLSVIKEVARGKMYFPFVDLRRMRDNPMHALTPRERALLQALSKGRTNAQLAKDMTLSVNTVKFHLGNLYQKLGVRNRSQAVAFYLNCRACQEAL